MAIWPTPTSPSGCSRACKREFGGLDIFVANAGVWPAGGGAASRTMPIERWRSTMAANLDSVFLSTRAALRLMAPGGRVVIVSSTAGQRGEAFHADYAATKGALISLTKSLAIECAPDIMVNCVAPGWVDTEMSLRRSPRIIGNGSGRPFRSADRHGRGHRRTDPLSLQRSRAPRDGEVLNVNGGSVLCG